MTAWVAQFLSVGQTVIVRVGFAQFFCPYLAGGEKVGAKCIVLVVERDGRADCMAKANALETGAEATSGLAVRQEITVL